MDNYLYYSMKDIADAMRKNGYSLMSENNDTTKESSFYKIYFNDKILVQVFYENTYIGESVKHLTLVDNRFGQTEWVKRYVLSTSLNSALFRYSGITIPEFLYVIEGDIDRIYMRIENIMTKKLLEAL